VAARPDLWSSSLHVLRRASNGPSGTLVSVHRWKWHRARSLSATFMRVAVQRAQAYDRATFCWKLMDVRRQASVSRKSSRPSAVQKGLTLSFERDAAKLSINSP